MFWFSVATLAAATVPDDMLVPFIVSIPLPSPVIVPLASISTQSILPDIVKSSTPVRLPDISALPSTSKVSHCNSPVISTPSDFVSNFFTLL